MTSTLLTATPARADVSCVAVTLEQNHALTGLVVSTSSTGGLPAAFSPVDDLLCLNSKRAGACNASSSTRP